MLSNDKNIETLAQLIEALKDYIGLQKEYLKFDVIDKFVRLVTALVLAVVLFVLAVAILFYLSFAVVYAMAPAVGTAWAFAIVAAFFFALFTVIIIFRKPWIERPLIRFMANILLG
jgi:hypothetical protein